MRPQRSHSKGDSIPDVAPKHPHSCSQATRSAVPQKVSRASQTFSCGLVSKTYPTWIRLSLGDHGQKSSEQNKARHGTSTVTQNAHKPKRAYRG
jgi:hypothetical protein